MNVTAPTCSTSQSMLELMRYMIHKEMSAHINAGRFADYFIILMSQIQ